MLILLMLNQILNLLVMLIEIYKVHLSDQKYSNDSNVTWYCDDKNHYV